MPTGHASSMETSYVVRMRGPWARGRWALLVLVMAASAAGQEADRREADRDPPTSASAPERFAPLTRPLAVRPQKVPAGAVQLAPAAATKASRSGVVRVPLSGRPEAGAAPSAPERDIFGIAAGAGRIDATRAEAPVLEVPTNSLTIVTSQRGKANIEQEELNVEQKTALPWLVVETQRTASEPAMRTGRPFLTLARAITWDASLSRHVAEFLFGLDAEDGEPGPLRQAVDVRFGVSCEDVTPARAQIGSIGPLGYDTVKVACSPQVKNERARQYLELFAGQGSVRYSFRIPHRPGSMVLTASDQRVIGFGFTTLTLTASQLEEDGSPLVGDEARTLLLTASGGDIDAAAITIPKGASEAHVEIRPSGIGALELVASSGAAHSAPLRLQLTWPLIPIAAMLAGGAFGGLSSTLQPRRRKQRARRVLEGSIMGLLVTLTVLLVPSLASLPARTLGTELGLFVIAAIAGVGGVPLVDRLATLVFPALSGEERPKRGDDTAEAPR
jgi:hypothetical protein